ncbi:MAG: hypothetical protein AAFP17_05890 [Pseudomonadota bacterium]
MAIDAHRSVIAKVRTKTLYLQAVIAGLDPATQGNKHPRPAHWIPRSSRGMTGAAMRNPGKAN